MGWCPNFGAEGGKGKKHNQPCGYYSLSFAQAVEPNWAD
jgi:hypothetical protein